MEGRGWKGIKYNGNKKKDKQWPNTVENGGRLYWKQMYTKEEEEDEEDGDEEEQKETL